MSRMISLRIDEHLLDRVDRERRREGVSRARALQQALTLWIERRRWLEAMERDRVGYETHPVRPDEFAPVLGAQRWPK